MDAKERARQAAAEHYYGKGTTNRGCCSAACKNCEYGGIEYECELCELAAAIEQAVSEALEEARIALIVPEAVLGNLVAVGNRPAVCNQVELWIEGKLAALRAKAGERSGG